jgi:hypothetical protein
MKKDASRGGKERTAEYHARHERMAAERLSGTNMRARNEAHLCATAVQWTTAPKATKMILDAERRGLLHGWMTKQRRQMWMA